MCGRSQGGFKAWLCLVCLLGSSLFVCVFVCLCDCLYVCPYVCPFCLLGFVLLCFVCVCSGLFCLFDGVVLFLFGVALSCLLSLFG